jgi:drug/metabolite transporter superfamily protein YnfA
MQIEILQSQKKCVLKEMGEIALAVHQKIVCLDTKKGIGRKYIANFHVHVWEKQKKKH